MTGRLGALTEEQSPARAWKQYERPLPRRPSDPTGPP